MNKMLFTSLLCVGGVLFGNNPALASTVVESIGKVGDNSELVPQLINYGSYIIGVGLGLHGISKLRQHTDNPQVPMSEGLSRLVGAAFFVSLPIVLSMMQATGNVDGGSVGSYQKIKALAGN